MTAIGGAAGEVGGATGEVGGAAGEVGGAAGVVEGAAGAVGTGTGTLAVVGTVVGSGVSASVGTVDDATGGSVKTGAEVETVAARSLAIIGVMAVGVASEWRDAVEATASAIVG